MTLILSALALVVLVSAIVLYNQLVQSKIHLAEAWSGIDVQLKRRHDLIPNIISAVQGYMQHERGVLETVTHLRNQVVAAQDLKAKAKAENDFSGAIKTLFAVAEAYPNLKADQHFLELQKTLSTIEDEIQLSRRYYNGTARNYNIRVQSFPGNLIAGLFHFQTAEFFELESALERQTPNVKI